MRQAENLGHRGAFAGGCGPRLRELPQGGAIDDRVEHGQAEPRGLHGQHGPRERPRIELRNLAVERRDIERLVAGEPARVNRSLSHLDLNEGDSEVGAVHEEVPAIHNSGHLPREGHVEG